METDENLQEVVRTEGALAVMEACRDVARSIYATRELADAACRRVMEQVLAD